MVDYRFIRTLKNDKGKPIEKWGRKTTGANASIRHASQLPT
jgi:hypothetical protein